MKEIDDKAKKCPYCQSFQSWYRNPQLLGLIFPFIFIPFIFSSTGLFSKKEYQKYSEYFSIKIVSESIQNKKVVKIYSVTNDTDFKWKNISYQIIGYDDKNGILITRSESSYSWVIQAHSTAYLSIETEPNNEIRKWEVKITDLSSGMF